MSKKSSKGKLFDLFEVSFPFLDAASRWSLAFKVDEDENYKLEDIVEIENSIKNELIAQGSIKKMYDAGFDLEHILLYLKAPDISPLENQTTKSEYLEKWSASNNFKPRINKVEMLERASAATGSMVVLAGALVVSGTFAYGYYKSNIDIVNTAQELSRYSNDTVGLLARALSDTSIMGLAVKLGASLALPAWSLIKLDKESEKAKDLKLSKNLPNNLSDEKRKFYIKKINDLPFHKHHFLTHFSGEELTLYLRKKDSLRLKMLLSNPPSFEQRCKAILSDDNKGFVTKWRERLQISLSSWDKDELFGKSITLKQRILNMRNKNQKIPTAKAGLAK